MRINERVSNSTINLNNIPQKSSNNAMALNDNGVDTINNSDDILSLSETAYRRLKCNNIVSNYEENIDYISDFEEGIGGISSAYVEYTERMNKVLGKIERHETVSQKDKEWIDGELQSIISGHYKSLRNIKLAREDVLNCLKENMEQRLRILNDMLEKVDANADVEINDFAFFQDEFEIKDRKELIEALTKSLEEATDDEKDELSDEELESDETDENQVSDGSKILIEEQPKKDELLASKVISRNKENIDSIKEQGKTEAENARFFSKIVEDIYVSTKKMITSSDFSYEEKAQTVKDFLERSSEATKESIIQDLKAAYDRQTVRMSNILFEAHDDIKEVLQRHKKTKGIFTSELILSLLRK